MTEKLDVWEHPEAFAEDTRDYKELCRSKFSNVENFRGFLEPHIPPDLEKTPLSVTVPRAMLAARIQIILMEAGVSPTEAYQTARNEVEALERTARKLSIVPDSGQAR